MGLPMDDALLGSVVGVGRGDFKSVAFVCEPLSRARIFQKMFIPLLQKGARGDFPML